MGYYKTKAYIINLNQTQYEKNKITYAACNDHFVASCFIMVMSRQ